MTDTPDTPRLVRSLGKGLSPSPGRKSKPFKPPEAVGFGEM
jgi:hypothetical protein